MTKPRIATLIAAGLIAGGALEARPLAAVTLGMAAQRQNGVTITRLAGARRAAEIDAFAKVLDPGPLAQLNADLVSAEAAAGASRAEAERARALHNGGGSIAARDAEAAIAQAGADAARVSLLRARLGLEWGPGVARLTDARRQRLIRALASGSAALVHVDTANNAGQDGARVVKIDIGDGSVSGVVLGPARAAEPRLQSSGLIAQVSGPLAVRLSVGLTQGAHIELAADQAGVVLPRSAIIRFRGSDWVYVRTSPTGFERRLVATPIVQEDGVFVAHGFDAGDQVVSQGAMILFADEQNQQAEGR